MRLSILFFCVFISKVLFAEISYDYHYHYTNSSFLFSEPTAKTRNFILNFQNKAMVDKTMLISDSYRYPYLSIGDERYRLQNELESFLQLNHDRMLGICSLNLSWPDALDYAKKCTKSEYIKGIKLHFDHEKQSLQNPQFKKQFISLLNILKDQPLFYLIHFDFHHQPNLEARELFKIASQFQKQNFIIAHGAEENFSVLAYIGKSFKQRPSLRQNIYTELSTVFTIESFFAKNPSLVLKAWQEFGINNILFGSDFPVSSSAIALEGLKESGLSPQEIEDITQNNGHSFFDSL